MRSSLWSRVGTVLPWLVFLGFGSSVLLWLIDRASGLYLFFWIGGLLGFLGIFVFGFGIVVWTLLAPRSWARWRLAVPALLLGALVSWVDVSPVARWNNERYVRQPELNAFAARVHGYGRISELLQYDGVPHTLNGTVVGATQADLDSLRRSSRPGQEPSLLADVLARDGIDPVVFEEVRGQMRRFGFQSFWIHGDYVAFRQHRDGGLLFAAEGAAPLHPGAVVPGSRFEVGRPMGRWHFFWCCNYSGFVQVEGEGLDL